MRTIDSHHHLWDLSRFTHEWLRGTGELERTFGVEDLTPLLDANGIDATVLVQCIHDQSETLFLLEVASGEPRIAGVVGWVDLEADDVGRRLDELRGGKLVGVRHLVHNVADPGWLRRPGVHRGLCELAGAGLTFDLLLRPAQMSAALDAVRAVGDLRFVVDHIAKPPIASGETEPWAGMMRRLAAEPNCYVKLSGMITEAGPGWTAGDLRPYVEKVVEWFSPSRCMFGSDWPVCLLAGSYDRVVQALRDCLPALSAPEAQDVWGAAAARFYGL